MTNNIIFKHLRSNVNGKTPNPNSCGMSDGVIAINSSKDGEKLFIQNSSNEIISFSSDNQNKSMFCTKDDLKALENKLSKLSDLYLIYGFVRANEDTDPSRNAEWSFGDKKTLDLIVDSLKLGLVKDGKLYKQCANGRIDVGIDGSELKIDGSDGDVMLFTTKELHFLKLTDVVNGVKINLFALGLAPFTVFGKNSKEIKPFAFTPQYVVKCKLDANNNDKGVVERFQCSHSIYNKKITGEFSEPLNFFNEKFKENGNGFFSNRMSLLDSNWMAQAKNASYKSNYPYSGGYYEFLEIIISMMFCELGTLKHSDLNSFGVGCTQFLMDDSNFVGDGMLGCGGFKFFTKNKEKIYYCYTDVNKLKTPTNELVQYILETVCGRSLYVYTEMLENQRLLNDVMKYGLVNKIYNTKPSDVANKSVVFEYDDMNVLKVSNITLTDLSNGTNMIPNKKYYQIRNIPNCSGMDMGVMTAVVNTYVKLTCKQGSKVMNAKGSYVDCDFCIVKFSKPIYRGYSFLEGCYSHVFGAHYVQISHNENGKLVPKAKFIYASDFRNIPPMMTDSQIYYGNETDVLEVEKGLDNSVDVDLIATKNGWVKTSDYNASLFCHTSHGGGQILNENAFNWFESCVGNNDNVTPEHNGLPKLGRKCVNAMIIGCSSNFNKPSISSVNNLSSCSDVNNHYVGRFSVSELQF